MVTTIGTDLFRLKLRNWICHVTISFGTAPARKLCFAAIHKGGLRCPQTVYTMFAEKTRELGFRMRFHDLRGSHATILLDRGCRFMSWPRGWGMIRPRSLSSTAKRTKKADRSAAGVIGALTKGILDLGRDWVERDHTTF
jgi:hypothetical protein